MTLKVMGFSVKLDGRELAIRCHAPREAFAPSEEEMPDEVRRVYNAQGGLPCSGYAGVGAHCVSCQWMRWEVSE